MAKTFHEVPMEVFSHQLIVAGIVVYGAPGRTRAEDNPPAAKPEQTKSQLIASDVQPGLVNDWLRNQSSLFAAWDLGGQFRAPYEHSEYLGPVDFSATGDHSSDNRMLLRTFVHAGYSSGDSNPTDGKHETFDNLFPTNHRQFGMMDIFSWENDQILRFMGSIQPLESLTVAADYRLIWLADTHDSFYTNKGARRGGLAGTDGTGYGINPNSSSYVGSEIDFVATHTIRYYTSLQAGIAHFFVGDYVKSSLARIGGARDATFSYAQFTLNF